MTLALAALAGRHFELAQVLHHNGSSVDLRGNHRNSPLHPAAYHGDCEMVQILLNYGVDINVKNNDGTTPLVFALESCFSGLDHTVVRLLLDHGADPNIPKKSGTTPLHLASQLGRIEIVRLLVERGASGGG
ncbi:ankyrin repeat protein [Russula ochroleuca]|uniref:Ankyrin repeat protein n=1 Tax=Russula ochroleuca TaxID=152965 RepID=A0A9P5JZT9_9AGAM|nr:ankyrin repeat protein [Russula ochroleuca]